MFEVVEIGGMKTVATKAPVNHVYIVDVSGSMYYDLPKVRQNLKNTMTLVAKPDDTFTVIYFSGKNQCGVVFENVLVANMATIDTLNAAIDRYITPIGLTCFSDPIELAMKVNLDSSKLNSFVMMTDGYNNQASVADIMSAVAKLPSKFQNITFIEYGYYADRAMIAKMAEAVNGTHIFTEGFTQYESAIKSVVDNTPRVQNVEVKVNKAAKHCVFVYNDQIRIVSVVDGMALVPEDVSRVHSIVPKDVLSKQLSAEHLYLIMFYASKQDNTELVWNTLQMLGDVALINKYTNAFTKQELSDFEGMVERAVLNVDARFVEGKDLTLVPSKNAPTVLQLLSTLAEDSAELVMGSPYWNYKRSGRTSVAQDELPRFVPSPLSNVTLNNLVFSSERPNVNIQTNVSGTVELPANEYGLKKVPSHIVRNYTIVKDGILNVDQLPVLITDATYSKLASFAHEVIESAKGMVYAVFDLRKIPVINRAMVEKVDLDSFASAVRDMNVNKAAIKVLGHYIVEDGGTTDKVKGLVSAHGEEAALWLSSIGVRDYGFSPVNTASAEATDEYESIQVICKIKGMSSLPAIAAVEKKLSEKKKLTVADALINNFLVEYKKVDGADTLVKIKNALVAEKRALEGQIARNVYSLVLGRKWFGDEDVVTTAIKFGEDETQLSIEKVRKMISV